MRTCCAAHKATCSLCTIMLAMLISAQAHRVVQVMRKELVDISTASNLSVFKLGRIKEPASGATTPQMVESTVDEIVGKVADNRRPIVLVTDTSRDADDTFALMIVKGLKAHFNLVGVVCTGSDPATAISRARVAKWWMDHLGLQDIPRAITITNTAASRAENNVGRVVFPQGVKKPTDNEIKEIVMAIEGWEASRAESNVGRVVVPEGVEKPKLMDGATLLYELLQQHPGVLELFALAETTAVAGLVKKIDEMGSEVVPKALYIQGQVNPTTFLADPIAYNMKMDLDSANLVLSWFSEKSIEIHLLGKYAAYEIELDKTDVQKLDAVYSGCGLYNQIFKMVRDFTYFRPDLRWEILPGNYNRNSTGKRVELRDLFDASDPAPRHETLKKIRDRINQNRAEDQVDTAPIPLWPPTSMIKPPPIETQMQEPWWDEFTTTVSTPYDPLLIFSALHPDYFHETLVSNFGTIGNEEGATVFASEPGKAKVVDQFKLALGLT